MTQEEIYQLESAICKAERAALRYENVDDGGACNFNAPAIRLKSTERELAKIDWSVSQRGDRHQDGTRWFVIHLGLSGKANRRSAMAWAAAKSLRESGFESMLYQQID